MLRNRFAKKVILFLIIILSCLFIYNNFILEKKYYLSYKYKDIANTDPVCKAYVDALNTYPLADDFFEAPIQPLSPELTYPKWEQLKIYDNKELFFRTNINRYISAEEYAENIDEFKKYYYYKVLHDDYDVNNTLEKELAENRLNKILKEKQMYYTLLDVDNDGKVDDIVRIDSYRYETERYPFQYHTSIYVFDAAEQKSFKKRVLNKFYLDTIYSFFFYKDKTYIKDITYDLSKYGFLYMYIKKFNDKKELTTLCFIDKE